MSPTRGAHCPLCAGPTRLAFSKEANVSCADYFEGRRLFADDQGEVEVRECHSCGFAWIPALHAWPRERFAAEIYNAGYALCDPPFKDARPRLLAAWLAPLCAGRSLLDYGGGEGRLALLLRAHGIGAHSYDPFHLPNHEPSSAFDIVTAFEVIEHVGAQGPLFAALAGALKPGGVLIFSTLLKPGSLISDWWYASARNGHISFHSVQSLAKTLEGAGLYGLSLSPELHVAARDPALLEGWRAAPRLQISGTPGFRVSRLWDQFAPLDDLSAAPKTA